MIVASVATTPNLLVLSLGDGRPEHYTYPPNGRFHMTPEDGTTTHSFFAPGPRFDSLEYHRLAIVPVPLDPTELARPYKSSPGQGDFFPAPTTREGILEVAILGQVATPAVQASLSSDGALLKLFQGPRSDTTIVFRYTL